MTTQTEAPTELAKRTSKPLTIHALLEKQKPQIAMALPKHLDPDRMMRVALTTINKNPKLGSCTQASLLACIMDCAALGIEPDNRRAHLIPYGDKCTLIIDYKGLVELMMRSGAVASIHADVVCQEDLFFYNLGIVEKHVIDFHKSRGEMYAAYVIIAFKDGSKKCEVMTREEIDSIRKRSKAGGSGPWVTDYNEMAKKTVFRRASKWVPLSPEILETLDKDADVLDIHAERIPEPKKPLFTPAIDVPEPESQQIEEQKEEKAEDLSEPLPPSDGEKTRFFNTFCQQNAIDIGVALNCLGDVYGYATFEDVNDRVIATIKKQPAVFVGQCKQMKGAK
jgi:recombination protein RecT